MTNCGCDFDVGDHVSFPGGKGEITKVDHRDDESCLLYIHTQDGPVKRPSALQIEKVATEAELIEKLDFESPLRFDLRGKAAELDLIHEHDRFVALGSSRIDIEPYQVQAAYEILNSHDQRYLIGDEVGLGKTIEAAIVIEELIARDRAERVLIVTPAPLTDQWQMEMQDKFGRDYIVYQRDFVEAKRGARPSENVWVDEDRIITSIDFAKQEDMLAALRNLDQEWDIAVFDESHHLTARRGSNGSVEKTERYRVGEAVAENTEGLLFLTGTPHKGKADQFYFMISLLDPYRFRDEFDITPDRLDDLMIRRLKEDMYETDGIKMFPEKNIETIGVNLTPEERALYEGVTEYIRDHYNRANRAQNNIAGFAMAIYQKRLVSSIHAIRQSLLNRVNTLKAGGTDPSNLSPMVLSLLDEYRSDPDLLTEKQREKVEEELGGVTTASNPADIQAELEVVQELYEQAKQIDTDSKAERLRMFIDGILEEDPDEKVLVFTEYTDTLEYLREHVLSDYDIAEIYGDLSTSQRREQIEKFRNDACIMIATDAAREGLNLQFAHIMVNYDLPWNPTRIDQRIGRLHRYNQEHTVEIRNLFINDTRESEILELLMDKLDEIESTLGMNSDVLGMVLDDFDLEDQIMSAVAKGEDPSQVKSEVDEIIEQQKDALKQIEDNFLIRDRFDLSEEDQEILEILERSRKEGISEEDIEELVRGFFEEFDGGVHGIRPGPARAEGDIFRLEVPSIISGGHVKREYDGCTFTREIAVENDDVEFISLDHPLVKSITEYCLDPDRFGGRTTVKVGSESLDTPGILCRFRLSYLSGGGETITERLEDIYLTFSGDILMDDIDLVGGIPPNETNRYSEIRQVAESASKFFDKAENRAWELVREYADEARTEREREITIKREHAVRYFEERLSEMRERLADYEDQQEESETGGQIQVNILKSDIEELKTEYDEELKRLREEEQIVPEEPKLVNAAVVIGLSSDR